MPGIDFDQLRRTITMEEVLDLFDFQPTCRSGSQLHGPCPVHGSCCQTSRSFSANLEARRYFCHKCGSHGNPLELWAAATHMELFPASIELCRALGREIPWVTRW